MSSMLKGHSSSVFLLPQVMLLPFSLLHKSDTQLSCLNLFFFLSLPKYSQIIVIAFVSLQMYTGLMVPQFSLPFFAHMLL